MNRCWAFSGRIGPNSSHLFIALSCVSRFLSVCHKARQLRCLVIKRFTSDTFFVPKRTIAAVLYCLMYGVCHQNFTDLAHRTAKARVAEESNQQLFSSLIAPIPKKDRITEAHFPGTHACPTIRHYTPATWSKSTHNRGQLPLATGQIRSSAPIFPVPGQEM